MRDAKIFQVRLASSQLLCHLFVTVGGTTSSVFSKSLVVEALVNFMISSRAVTPSWPDQLLRNFEEINVSLLEMRTSFIYGY